MKLVTTQNLPTDFLAELGKVGVQVIHAADEPTLLQEIVDADALVGGFGGGDGGRFQRALQAARKLRWVHTSSAGVDPLLCPELAATGAALTCAKGEVVGSLLAEHAFALLLALSRGVAWSARQQSWNRSGLGGRAAYEIRGTRMGIVGYGGTGVALAQRAAAFGMTIIAVKRTAPGTRVPPPPLEALWGLDRLDDLLGLADVVVSTVPGTADSRGQFNTARFRRMKSTALFINVGRGDTVVTDDLVQALQNGWIAGAGLDVTDPEPLPAESPLWRMENVIVSPHIAGNSPQRGTRNLRLIRENAARLLAGQALVGVVDTGAGY